MGSAIAERIKRKYRLFVFDKDKEKTKNLKNIRVADNIIELLEKIDALVLAVKPQDFGVVLKAIKEYARTKLIISIAAGIPTDFIEASLGKVRVIRAMPNLPAKVGKGMICLCKGRYAKKNDLDFAKELFRKLGGVLILKEKMMDASTAISGSGPGFFYYIAGGKNIKEIRKIAPNFTLRLTEAAQEKGGFSYDTAKILAETTIKGSIMYLQETKLSPAEAKIQVASKGGTTEAGLEVLLKHGSLTEAVEAAMERAKELGVKFIKVG